MNPNTITQNVMVLHASSYDFTDKTSGKNVAGVSLYYIATTDLNPAAYDGKTTGYMPTKASFSLDKSAAISEVPAIYEFDCELTVTAKGPSLKPVNFRFLQPLDFSVDLKK